MNYLSIKYEIVLKILDFRQLAQCEELSGYLVHTKFHIQV